MNFIDRHCFILLIEGELIYFSRLAPFLNAGGRIGIENLEWKGQPMNQPVEKFTAYFLSIFILLSVASRDPRAATIAEVTSKIASLSPRDGKEILINGAKKEGQMVYYGTLPVNQFAALKSAFNSRYPFLDLKHYYSPRQGILNRALNEARAGRHAVDVIQVDVSYGFQLLNEGLVQPYLFSGRQQFYDGTYDREGYWYSMYHLTTALAYNTHLVKPQSVPRSYNDLLNPMWKGNLVFDSEAGYILAAMEQSWGREKAVETLTKLSSQEPSFRRGGTLTSQLVAAGEYPIAIAVNGETSAAMRDQGAPLSFAILSPKIIKPEGLFLAKNAPNPHAALLFVEWVLSEEGQKFLGVTLGKGIAMKGVQSRYKEFQIQPDFVVSPALGPKLKRYIEDFKKIFGIF